MKKAPTLAEASPYKSVAEELETLRQNFRVTCHRFGQQIEAEITELHERVMSAGTAVALREKSDDHTALRKKDDTTLEKVHNLRDMLALLRNLQIKPADGRRKDLKKVEAVVAELQILLKDWA